MQSLISPRQPMGTLITLTESTEPGRKYSWIWPARRRTLTRPLFASPRVHGVFDQNFAYPQSHTRNLARKTGQTPYVFLVDIDQWPNPGLASDLTHFLKSPEAAKLGQKVAFVVVSYELSTTEEFPNDKQTLLEYAGRNKARPFHWICFKPNQGANNYSR